ncbi:MAG: undecaprenyl-diphosphate phosphatase [Halieaceae bacterium]|nr:undecaprenyl-diphosphate phosphatase [Halieaceae bacterium]
MEWHQALLLAIVQGLTEFLPISSSAHLVFSSQLLGWPDQGLAFDVAVHVGTLLAVVTFYRTDIQHMGHAWVESLRCGASNEDSQLVWYLAFASLPIGLAGVFGSGFIESEFRNLPTIATANLLFGLLLGAADRNVNRRSTVVPLTLAIVVVIGLAQTLALIPGVSRSGVTITAALLLGLDRQAAARFSFLLSIPVITGAGGLLIWKLSASGVSVDWPQLGMAALVSAVTAYACIALFIRLLDTIGLMPFVYYRVILAGLLYFIWLM